MQCEAVFIMFSYMFSKTLFPGPLDECCEAAYDLQEKVGHPGQRRVRKLGEKKIPGCRSSPQKPKKQEPTLRNHSKSWLFWME